MIYFNKKNKTLKAFTMVELLVAISIIALILTVAIFSFTNTREDSRNSQRVSDVKQIQLALEKYYSDHRSYPSELVFGQPLVGSNGQVYMNNLPTNPSPRDDGDCTDEEYQYIYNPSNDTYEIIFCISRKMEAISSGKKAAVPMGIGEPYVFTCGDNVPYEGEIYPTVQIGEQCWFARNLNVGVRISGLLSTDNQTDNGIIEKYCFEELESMCDTNGGLYQWDEAMQYSKIEGSQGICPLGWHIPTDAELTTLTRYVINDPFCDPETKCSPAGTKLKAVYTGKPADFWGGFNGTDDYGFSLVVSGYRWNAGGYAASVNAYLSTSLEIPDTNAMIARLLTWSETGVIRQVMAKKDGYSIRCIKD